MAGGLVWFNIINSTQSIDISVYFLYLMYCVHNHLLLLFITVTVEHLASVNSSSLSLKKKVELKTEGKPMSYFNVIQI